MNYAEIDLQGGKYTWTNGQDIPTMSWIDRVFYFSEWNLLFPSTTLTVAASTLSDHCPLVLHGNSGYKKHLGFRFESFWIAMPGFHDVMLETWNISIHSADAM